MSLRHLIHERPVEHGLLPIRLPRHEQVPCAGGGIGNREILTGAEQDELRGLRLSAIGAECGLTFQHVGEALELRWDWCGDLPPVGSSMSRMSAGVPRCSGDPSPTSVRTVASPS